MTLWMPPVEKLVIAVATPAVRLTGAMAVPSTVNTADPAGVAVP